MDEGKENEKTTLFALRIGGDKLKLFSSNLNMLRSVGRELVLEVERTLEKNVLTIRTLTDAKTAIVVVTFESDFFERGSFNLFDLDSFSCKLQLRPLCAICKSFRNVSSMSLRAEIRNGEHELVLEMLSALDVRRTHRFKYSDCEIVSATFDDSECSSLRSSHKIFVQMLEHFYQSPEIKIEVSSSNFKVRSYHPPSDHQQSDAKKHLDTDLTIDVGDFDYFDCRMDADNGENAAAAASSSSSGAGALATSTVDLIFCVREVRALLSLCDATAIQEITLSFLGSGKPIKIVCVHENFWVELVLTTLFPRDAASSSSHAASAPSTQSQQHQKAQHHQKGSSSKFKTTKTDKSGGGGGGGPHIT